jgi:hypothetical protein
MRLPQNQIPDAGTYMMRWRGVYPGVKPISDVKLSESGRKMDYCQGKYMIISA